MAPAVNSAKALQQNRPRPTVPKTVLPVIPLPYIQKRKQVESAREAAKEAAKETDKEEVPAVKVEETPSLAAVSSLPSAEVPAESAADQSTEEVNGVVENHTGGGAESDAKMESPSGSVQPAAELEESNSTHTLAASGSSVASIEPQVSEELEFHEQPPVTVQDQEAEAPQKTPTSVPSEARSATSRSTFHMPPPFVPASSQHTGTETSESHKNTPHHFNGQQHPVHQPHPSASSLMFGGYPDSTTSSPVPPTSASNPPYPYPQQIHFGSGARHGPHASNGSQSLHMSNGYSPMGPPPSSGYYPRPDGHMNHVNGGDGFARRQMVSFGPPEGISPSGTPFGIENQRHAMYDPATPHSFHGSQQSSVFDPENPMAHNGYPPVVMSNGSNGHIEDVRLYQQPRPKPPTGPLPTGYGAMPLPPLDHLDGLVTYLQTQFGDSTFADYTLELRYSDDRAEPVRIPGHNIIFARSPTLKILMTAEIQKSNLTPRTLLIESDDRYLRSDGFSMAVQRLYGGSLLDLGAIANNFYSSITSRTARPLPGTPADRFDLALGYAAAGQILQMPPIMNRGVEIASHFVSWETVDKAFDFSLDGGLDSQWMPGEPQREQLSCPSTYGPAVNMLMYHALNFVISSFPPQFDLDICVKEAARNRRLPVIEENRPVPSNPLLSRIQFGDHEEESTHSTNPNVILSKLLINLPYHLVKYILESPRLGNVQGWATAKLRGDVMRAVVEEREKRRQKVRESKQVLNEERRVRENEWLAVGWEEQVVVVGGGSDLTPSLSKVWVGFEAEGN